MARACRGAGTLRVLLVDSDGDRAAAVEAGLVAAGCIVVGVVGGTAELTRAVRDSGAEVIVCGLDDPSRDELEGMRALHRDEPRPVVLFAEKAAPEQIEAALEAGVAAYVVEGMAPGPGPAGDRGGDPPLPRPPGAARRTGRGAPGPGGARGWSTAPRRC